MTDSPKTPQTADGVMRADASLDLGGGTYVIGHQPLDIGTIVRYQVFMNCVVGDKANKKFVAVPLHEIPLLRRLHKYFGGDLEILATGYAMGLKQVRGLTQKQCEAELTRLAGKDDGEGQFIEGAYLLPPKDKESPTINIFNRIYGERGPECRFFRVMKEMYLAWCGLVKRCKAQNRTATVEDIEAIVVLASPEPAMLNSELIPTGMDDEMEGASVTPAAHDAPAIDHGLMQFLASRGCPDKTCASFARAVATYPDPAAMDDAAWKTVAGVGGHHGKRNALIKHLGDYLAGKPAVEPVMQG